MSIAVQTMSIDGLALGFVSKPALRARRAPPAHRHVGGLRRSAVPDRQAVHQGLIAGARVRTNDAQT
jgi:hypothetical protein